MFGNPEIHIFKNIYLFICLFLVVLGTWCAWVVLVAVLRLSLVSASRGYSLVAAHRLLIAVVSLVAEHGLNSCGTYGSFPDQGSNPWSPTLAGEFLTIGSRGKSLHHILFIHSIS